jgi:hypothetical protein
MNSMFYWARAAPAGKNVTARGSFGNFPTLTISNGIWVVVPGKAPTNGEFTGSIDGAGDGCARNAMPILYIYIWLLYMERPVGFSPINRASDGI